MSSFSNPHYMYLFEMKNGKKKLAYGNSPEDALDILRIRLTDEEMAELIDSQGGRARAQVEPGCRCCSRNFPCAPL